MFAGPTFDQHDLVAHHCDPESGLEAIVAIHARRDGRGCGGCRMQAYATEAEALDDVLRLSRAMSYKAAMADAPAGGAKAVIIGDPRRDKTEARLLAMGRLIERFAGSYISAPDVGIGVEDLRVFRRESDWVVGADDVAGPSAPYTALGVFAGMRAAVRWALDRETLDGVRVAIQGVGSVGHALAGLLAAAGAQLVVADVDSGAVERVVDELGARPATATEILSADVDVLSPCALGGVLHSETIPALRARVVCGAANNQLLEARHGRMLRARGIAYAPDYIVSAGGLIAGMEELSGFDARVARERVERIEETLAAVFEFAEREAIPESDAADRIAEQRIASWRLAPRRA